MLTSLWSGCLRQLQSDLSGTEFNTWIRPLQAVEDNGALKLLAPNKFVVDWVEHRCLSRIREVVARDGNGAAPPAVLLQVGSRQVEPVLVASAPAVAAVSKPAPPGGKLNRAYTFLFV